MKRTFPNSPPETNKSKDDVSVFTGRSFCNWITLALIIGVFIYTCIRSYYLSITHDEAVTFNVHATGSYYEIVTYALPVMSNNHLLNSLLIKLFCTIFGISEFVIRIPALIGHALYLVGVYMTLKLFLKRHVLIIGTIVMIIHPFLIDYFSCARGYSLGLGFLALSIYFLFKRIERRDPDKDTKYSALSSIMITMAVFSSLSFSSVFFTIIGILFVVQLKEIVALMKCAKPKMNIFRQFIRRIIVPILPCIVLVVLVYANPVVKMLEGDEFWWGAFDGIWKNTVASLIESTMYGQDYVNIAEMFWSKVIIVSIIGVSLIIILRDLYKRDITLVDKYLILSVSIVAINCLILKFQNILFGLRYPINRTAIYFIPIFILIILTLWRRIELILNLPIRWVLSSLMFILALTMIFHLVLCLNITHYSSFKYDASTKALIDYIVEENMDKQLESNSIRLGIDWLFEPSINFYLRKDNIDYIKEVDRSGPYSLNDYYYLYVPNIGLFEKYDLKIVKYFEVAETYLAKPVTSISR